VSRGRGSLKLYRNLRRNRGVLCFKGAYALAKRRNLCEQLLDKANKLVFREIFETG